MKRVFTFGCSVTKHVWPTWADIVLHSAVIKGYSVFNMGLSGAGNKHIKDSVIQADEKYHFTEDDLILVMWTSWFREDRLTTYGKEVTLNNELIDTGPLWTGTGNVYNSDHYSKEFIDLYAKPEHYIISCITDIITIRKLYRLNHEGSLPIHSGDNNAVEVETTSKDGNDTLEAKSWEAFNSINMPNVFNDARNTWENKPEYAEWYRVDGHPVPGEALQYVQTCVEKGLPFPIQAETIKWVKHWGIKLLKDSSHTSLYKEKYALEMINWYDSVQMGVNSDIWCDNIQHNRLLENDGYGIGTVQAHTIIKQFVNNHNADFPEDKQTFSISPEVK
jgi:hypothetical protein